MITAVVADDEAQLVTSLTQSLKQVWPELHVVHQSPNGVDAADAIARLDPDLAFLDIQMPGLTGLEVAQGIEGHTRVVFVTAFDEFAVAAFESEAIDYLLKPVSTDRLARTMDRVRRSLAEGDLGAQLHGVLERLAPTGDTAQRLRWIRASQGEVTHQIAVDDVLFFHADDKYTCVQTAQGEHLIRMPITELVARLDPTQFWQVHRSTIVNLAHLSGTRRDEASRLFLRLRGHSLELPVSRAYVHRFKAM